MPPENVALVKRFEDRWTRRDLDAALEYVHTDFEFDWSESIGPVVGTSTGHDRLARFWTDLLDAWEHFSPTIEEVIECGPEGLITLDVVRGRGKESGIDMEARGAMLWALRKDKIIRVQMFQTKAEALEAAGLSA